MWWLPNSMWTETLVSGTTLRWIPSALAAAKSEWRRWATTQKFLMLKQDLVASTTYSNVSTSVTRRKHPWQSTLFSSNTETDTAAIFSSVHVDYVVVTIARACTMHAWVYTKNFLWRHEKSLRSAIQNTVRRVSRNKDLFQWGLR